MGTKISTAFHCCVYFTLRYILIEVIKIRHIHLSSVLSIMAQSTISYIISIESSTQKVSTPAEVDEVDARSSLLEAEFKGLSASRGLRGLRGLAC